MYNIGNKCDNCFKTIEAFDWAVSSCSLQSLPINTNNINQIREVTSKFAVCEPNSTPPPPAPLPLKADVKRLVQFMLNVKVGAAQTTCPRNGVYNVGTCSWSLCSCVNAYKLEFCEV